MHVRVFLSRWRGYHPCPDCHGARLRPEALAVKVGGLDIAALSALTIREARAFLAGLGRPTARQPGRAAGRWTRSQGRLDYLDRIGLDYLTLDRPARTLSAGEAQRRRADDGAGLGAGQHALRPRRALGRPAPARRRPADRDRRRPPRRGQHGGRRRARPGRHPRGRPAGRHRPGGRRGGRPGPLRRAARGDRRRSPGSATAEFLSGRQRVAVPERRRAADRGQLTADRGAAGTTSRAIDVAFPLGVLCVVTGVSGSGKSTLVEETLYPALRRRLGNEALAGRALSAS